MYVYIRLMAVWEGGGGEGGGAAYDGWRCPDYDEKLRKSIVSKRIVNEEK